MSAIGTALIICHLDPSIGLGHFRRALVVAKSLLSQNQVSLQMIIFGDYFQTSDLDNIPHTFVSLKENFTQKIEEQISAFKADALIFDIHPKFFPQDLKSFLQNLRKKGIQIIGIDSLRDMPEVLDVSWIPSFYVSDKYRHSNTKFGWDSYLIQRKYHSAPWSTGMNVMVTIGGGDTTGLGKTLPEKLDRALPTDMTIHWIKGPMAERPVLPESDRKWIVYDSPNGIDEIILKSNYALSVFGVTFFEILQHGLPTTVFSPYGIKDNEELLALKKEDVAAVANNTDEAVSMLTQLITDNKAAETYSKNAKAKLAKNGGEQIAFTIENLINNKNKI